MDPTVVLETTPLPEKFFDMKCEAYSLINEETKKIPHLRNGWKIINKETGERYLYGAFSNFARYPFTVDGVRYITSEHYYQSKIGRAHV